MPTPRIPSGLKPLVRGYGVGAPEGVLMTQVAGGNPRIALQWANGHQPFEVSMLNDRLKDSVWLAFFHKIIRNGSVQFLMPINSAGTLEDHLCFMVPGSYRREPSGSGLHWLVSFIVIARSKVYGMTDQDAQAVIDVYEDLGETSSEVLRLLELAANGPASDWRPVA